MVFSSYPHKYVPLWDNEGTINCTGCKASVQWFWTNVCPRVNTAQSKTARPPPLKVPRYPRSAPPPAPPPDPRGSDCHQHRSVLPVLELYIMGLCSVRALCAAVCAQPNAFVICRCNCVNSTGLCECNNCLLTIGRHLGCFWGLSTTDKTAMNRLVQGLLWTNGFISLRKVYASVFVFSLCTRVCESSTSSLIFDFDSIFNSSHSNECKMACPCA